MKPTIEYYFDCLISCKRGYYGDPTRGSALPCQACLCPGGAGSGNQFSETCQLDQATQTVQCDCFSGYTGKKETMGMLLNSVCTDMVTFANTKYVCNLVE